MKFIFATFIAMTMLVGCMMESKELKSCSHKKVFIDREIWTKTSDIRWPSSAKYVVFFNGERIIRNECLSSYSQSIKEFFSHQHVKGLRVGEVCGKLVVLYRDDEFTKIAGHAGVEFAANHEAFHLAAQIYGMKVPLEYLASTRESEGRATKKFFAGASNLFSVRKGQPPTRGDICKFIESDFLGLSDDERGKINSIVYWEWPAEYYAYELMRKKKLSVSMYIDIRAAAGSYEEYSPGISAGQWLDSAVGRRVWQAQAGLGLSMLDIIGKSCFNDYPVTSRPSVVVKKRNLFN